MIGMVQEPLSGADRGRSAPLAAAGHPRRARLVRWARIDLAPAHRQPGPARLALATLLSLAGSLGADELAVHVGTSLFPATAHFSHFRFSDYATLTIVGVLVASAAWPMVTRLTSSPRWLFLRMAIAVTVALWLPDGWLLLRGQSGQGVAVLMVMHLLTAVVTYNGLVRVAPVGPGAQGAAAPAPELLALTERAVRRLWSAMALLVAVELVLGVATIVWVPFRRPDVLLPTRATWLYAAHGAIGIALGVGAVGVLLVSTLADRMARIGAALGAVGVLVGLAGGVFATFQVTRLLGMGVMMVGVLLAGVGYMVPSLEAMGRAEAARAEAARRAVADARKERRRRLDTVGGSGTGPRSSLADGECADVAGESVDGQGLPAGGQARHDPPGG
jgi:hypothetical protein